ncbi:uncharacterized protein MYCFIDRAFT_175956 [Pseudocercospora fijiensis CIRAD86]|uniref:Uncharacterized protein n=1 Tax=Pseudocercospora fijiensis (strain CIRAD86) TaxID=383855 RepID=M3ACY8_PSEFD|nr:uncharacterized protein MYCFIDRAFT_175956 [Pseudocercospora fijiensis CIRAD86]EME82416.1 hypothetical protein MYCFIDRAFT_175956 [Pseudocercospora fijiensis CIRAD86]
MKSQYARNLEVDSSGSSNRSVSIFHHNHKTYYGNDIAAIQQNLWLVECRLETQPKVMVANLTLRQRKQVISPIPLQEMAAMRKLCRFTTPGCPDFDPPNAAAVATATDIEIGNGSGRVRREEEREPLRVREEAENEGGDTSRNLRVMVKFKHVFISLQNSIAAAHRIASGIILPKKIHTRFAKIPSFRSSHQAVKIIDSHSFSFPSKDNGEPPPPPPPPTRYPSPNKLLNRSQGSTERMKLQLKRCRRQKKFRHAVIHRRHGFSPRHYQRLLVLRPSPGRAGGPMVDFLTGLPVLRSGACMFCAD